MAETSDVVETGDALDILEIATTLPRLIQLMKKLGRTKDQAKEGFANVVDSSWDQEP